MEEQRDHHTAAGIIPNASLQLTLRLVSVPGSLSVLWEVPYHGRHTTSRCCTSSASWRCLCRFLSKIWWRIFCRMLSRGAGPAELVDVADED